VDLVQPAAPYLPGYREALRRGWSPDNVRGTAAALEELQEIERDPLLFLEGLTDPYGRGPPIILPDGSQVPRLPGFRLWIWDGEFCGSVGFRWQPGTPELPPYCLGHMGYAVVPWKQRLGYATRALALLLPFARARGLPYVELTTDPDNVPSQRVILANGGVLHSRFRKTEHYGHSEGLLYRIHL
jgi:predicted acetyltransferase